METIHHADAIIQNILFTFHQRIGRQSAIAFANAHGAACGVKAQAQFRGRVNRIL